MNQYFSQKLSIENMLLQTKALEPLPAETVMFLEEVQKLDVSGYSEEEVRAEVIDPIVRALGYKKTTPFFVERNKSRKLARSSVVPDYVALVLEENFWVIEAKKPAVRSGEFGAEAIKQAVFYAAHPEINAALVVLCDGVLFHVYDREFCLSEPVIKIEISSLVENFDKIRLLLGPWQSWFFQKRRVIRLVDKVFDREINFARAEEFCDLIDERLLSKRISILDNSRKVKITDAEDSYLEYARGLPTADLVDIQFFMRNSKARLSAIANVLVERCATSQFPVIHKIFPDLPRDSSHHYWSAALFFLLTLTERVKQLSWVPSYLSPSGLSTVTTSDAVKCLIALCLTGFASRESEKIVLLYSAAVRRISKQIITISGEVDNIAKMRHLLLRHMVDEFSLSQLTSSKEGHLLNLLDDLEMIMVKRFVDESISNCRFNSQKAKQNLLSTWRSEKSILGNGGEYRLARDARDLGEVLSSEAVSVVYDQMGHAAICVLDHFPEWKEYALSNFRDEIERISRFGSGAARGWIGVPSANEVCKPTHAQLADHFFFGDVEMCRHLVKSYGYSSCVLD